MTIGRKAAPKTNPEKAPPTFKTQVIEPTKLSEIRPANGMIKKISVKPMISKHNVGVTIISIASGITRCSTASNFAKSHTAKITPMIPPWLAAKASPVNKFWIGASGFIPVSKMIEPITPPRVGLALKTCAALTPVKIAK